MEVAAPLPLRQSLRLATAFPIPSRTILGCLDRTSAADALFERAFREGLSAIEPAKRLGLAPVTGQVAEAVAAAVLGELGYELVWQITTSGVRGVDLVLLAPDASLLALEVKGTLRPGSIPRLTPSRARQMSREWLSDPANPGMADWGLSGDDLYGGVIVVDFARRAYRIALSGDHAAYAAVVALGGLRSLRRLDELKPPHVGSTARKMGSARR